MDTRFTDQHRESSVSSSAPGMPLTALSARAERQFATWADFLASGMEATGFHLPSTDPSTQDALLWQIRTSVFWPAWVALDEGAPGSRLAQLADGRQTLSDAREGAERVARARAALPYGTDGLDLEERVLHFLYLRDGARLQPLCDRHSRLLYRYPLVEALGANEDQAAQLVQSLQRRRWLEADAPIDRTRHCRQCSGAHPHYFDVCPHCRSIQIERAMALHCFTCGHVAPQADFQQESALVCPQCHARLRHIGVDYDRPLVQYACADCHHVFIETSVLTRCLDCDAVAAPDALDVRVVAPLRLAARARAMLRQNLQDDLDSDPLTSGYVPIGQFRRMLDWVLAAGRSARSQTFTLVRVATELVDQRPPVLDGEHRQRIVDELAGRIRELLDDADLCARDAHEHLWLLLPRGDATALVREIQQLVREGSPVRVHVSARRLPDERRPAMPAAQLMAQWQPGEKEG